MIKSLYHKLWCWLNIRQLRRMQARYDVLLRAHNLRNVGRAR